MANFDWHAERTDLSGLVLLDRAPESDGINLKQVRLYRQARLREQMAKYKVDAVILSDPVNIRYATGTRNMQIFSMRNAPSRYLLLTSKRSILFEFTGCSHLADGYETVDEVRVAKTASFVAAGPKIEEREKAWAVEMGELIVQVVKKPTAEIVVGLERLNANTAIQLRDFGFSIVDAQRPIEIARAIKSPEEVKCVVASLRATEIAVAKLREAIRPGLTENELWSVLHKSVIEQNGDYCETRLLSAGSRTNPWFQETASYKIRPNDLIALDTDVVTHNMGILKPGMTFREYADQAWDIPAKYYKNRYYLSAHGCGLTGEYPYLYHHGDFPDAGYDGVIEPGMVICVESYIGEDGGPEGVKLEQQVLVTEVGIKLLSEFPFESSLLD
ncbi:hypothetical protein ACHAPQ_012112 [Fusarium lateritium]